jgi:Carboxypeptidase regulatory-like domain
MLNSYWINQRPKFRSLALLVLLTCAVVLLMPVQPSYAQQAAYATISGTVTDQQGALVGNANLTITNTDTGVKRDTVTGSDGGYTAPFLPVGHYSVTASHPGFKTTTQPGITLTADQKATVNIALAVGDVKETAEVSVSQTALETQSAALGEVINSTSVEELPLNGRDPDALTYLVPGGTNGTARTSAITIAGNGSGMPNEIGASIDASRMGGIYYQLDGVYNMDNYLASANPFPNADATQEFRVLTNNFSAEYGGGSTAVVSVVTRSGTDQWHGNAFEFARNKVFNAADWFSHVPDGLSRHQFGSSVGGPLQKGKHFIFGNLQFTKQSLQNNGSPSYVPTNAMLNNGDFSGAIPPPYGSGCPNASTSPGAGTQLHDYDGTPFPCNQIPTSMFSQVALNIEQYIPKTDDAGGLVYVPGANVKSNTQEFTIKYDWNPNSNNHVMGRVFYQNYNQPKISSNTNWLATADSWIARNVNYAASWTHTVSPTLVNNAFFGYDHLTSESVSGIPKGWKELGANIPQPDPHNATVLVSWGSTGFSWFEQNVIQKRHDWNIGDQVSWIKGKHMIVAGVNVLDEYSLEQASWLADPLVYFNGAVTGSFFSDFILGDLGNFEQGGGEYNVYSSPEVVAFADDTIRLRPNLTLELGLRYEPWRAPRPTPSGRTASWWPGHQSTVYPNAPQGLVFPGDAGVPAGGYPNDFGRISPRIGLAWQPSFLPKTSIRAGFGRFSIPYYYTYYNHVGANPPFSPSFQLTPSTVENVRIPFEDPWSVFAPTGGVAPFPPFAQSGTKPGPDATFLLPASLPAIFTPQFKLGWSQNWNLSIQHQFTPTILVTAAYVGSQAYDIATGAQLNPGIYSAGGTRTRYPNFSSVLVYEPWGTASYNGLHLSLEKRFSNGFQFVSNYAWSKSLDLLSQSDLSSGPLLRNAYNPRIDHGISALNVPYVWSNAFTWRLSGFKNHGALAAGALGNWEVSGIFSMTAGVPFSVAGGNGSNNSESQNGNDLADLTGQPLNVHKGSEAQWVHQYFNPAAFKVNAPGTFGNSPKNLMRGPADDNLDLAVAKNFPFRKERYGLQFRWEMFNATNTPWFGLPVADPSNPAFGQINALQGKPRIMQFGLKLHY